MKKLGLEHHGASTYLVYELGPEDSVDSMSLGMLVNNRIPGFAPTIFTQTDNIKQIKCDGSGARRPVSSGRGEQKTAPGGLPGRCAGVLLRGGLHD